MARVAATAVLAVALIGCSFLAVDDNDHVWGPVGGMRWGIELQEASPAETRGAISRRQAIGLAASEVKQDAEAVTSASLGKISTTQRGGDLISGPIAWAIVWERDDGVDAVVVDAFQGTILSVGSSNSP